ncbi:hypothetical protein NEUTE2DRAFT_168292 [Neurospora tetrasperma FGSC 2509]|nr:hypothetical protein NEUTE2DRAFT_168292 [Neurospora tetrasperma FGSC 2509]
MSTKMQYTTIHITLLSSIAFISARPQTSPPPVASCPITAQMPCVAQNYGAALAPVVGQVVNAICEQCVTKA